MPRVSKKVQELSELSFTDLIKRMTFGFELETLTSGRMTREIFDERWGRSREKFDQFKHLQVKGLTGRIARYLDSPAGLALCPIISFSANDLAGLDDNERTVVEFLSQLSYEGESLPDPLTPKQVQALGLTKAFKDFLGPEAIRTLSSSINKDLTSNVQYRYQHFKDYASRVFKPSRLLDVGTDGSVPGFEFRTQGGLTAKEFLTAAEEVFSIQHDVDYRCSFHIHTQVQNITHDYGEDMQKLLMEYSIYNMHMLPDSVIERWQKEAGRQINEYFVPHISTEKYSFVNYNDSFNTWEFRAFGNITSVQEARACLVMAAKAIHYAYKAKAGKVERIKPVGEWDVNKALVYIRDFQRRTSRSA